MSYFDYYQPEAYIASTDTYIEKDSRINEEIEKPLPRRHRSSLTRRDTIIISSVSCIYGIGSPASYQEMSLHLKVGDRYKQEKFLRHLKDIQYDRNDVDFARGTFRVRGDTVDILTASSRFGDLCEFAM